MNSMMSSSFVSYMNPQRIDFTFLGIFDGVFEKEDQNCPFVRKTTIRTPTYFDIADSEPASPTSRSNALKIRKRGGECAHAKPPYMRASN
jgi:hypothetical protein